MAKDLDALMTDKEFVKNMKGMIELVTKIFEGKMDMGKMDDKKDGKKENMSKGRSRRDTNGCCKAMIASCLACDKKMTVPEYCAMNPKTQGCDTKDSKNSTDTTMCCMAMTASCMSCQQKMTVEDFCAKNPKTQGCDSTDMSMMTLDKLIPKEIL